MVFPVEYIPYVNGVILIAFALNLVIGIKDGFLLKIVSLVSTIAILIFSFVLAPFLSVMFPLIQKNAIEGLPDIVSILINQKLNDVVWFVIIFVVMKIVFSILKTFTRSINKIILIGQINRIAGGILGIVEVYVLCIMAILLLSNPFVKNGRDVINQTYLKPLGIIGDTIITRYQDSELEKMMNGIMKEAVDLTQEQMQQLNQWLNENLNKEIDLNQFNEE